MKKNNYIYRTLVALFTIAIFTGCGSLDKMVKDYNTVKYDVTPPVLETHGDKISVTVKGKIPENYFQKKATVEFSPVLKYDGGEVKLKSLTLSGEGVKDAKGTVIAKKAGGSFTYTDVIKYKPEMNKSILSVNVKATMKKTVEFGERKLADGVIYTSKRIQKEEEVLPAKDNYNNAEEITSKSADLFFEWKKSKLDLKLPMNKKKENIDAVKALVDFASGNLKMKNIDVNAWASPEGEENYNKNLSGDRAKTAEKYIKEKLKAEIIAKAKKENPKKNEKALLKEASVKEALEFIDKVNVNITGNGEDWDGFIKSINNSGIKDKNVILNVVNAQQDRMKRQKEINNMVVIYKEVEKEILPTLRRAEMKINYAKPKKSDEQILKYATTTPDSLTVEELLYASSLTKDENIKLKIYKSATTVFPQDWRGYNNVALIDIKQGNVTEAASYLDKANTLAPNTGIVLNNLGVLAAWKKDYETAKSYYESAQQKGVNTSFNMGILSIVSGDYKNAINQMSSKNCSANLGLAYLLSNDLKNTGVTLDCAEKTPAVYYLRAIAASRSGNASMMVENLKSAIKGDSSYKAQAKDDREFIKFFDNADFQNIVR
ncbi:MAG: hypothetical protein Q8880_10575 [Bacteroidota bacterium]|nr:hypothetical protein [Bacteroidota bacterium]